MFIFLMFAPCLLSGLAIYFFSAVGYDFGRLISGGVFFLSGAIFSMVMERKGVEPNALGALVSLGRVVRLAALGCLIWSLVVRF